MEQHAKRAEEVGLLAFAFSWLLALALFDPEERSNMFVMSANFYQTTWHQIPQDRNVLFIVNAVGTSNPMTFCYCYKIETGSLFAD
jgi:hypothetical protein